MAYWEWLALGLILAALEIVTTSFVLIWFGLAAILLGFLLWLRPDIDHGAQLTIFGLTALVLLIPAWTIRIARRRRVGAAPPSNPDLINDRAAHHIGLRVVLTEPIAQGRGRIFIGDTLWQLSGPDLPAGQAIRVVGVEGSTLKVEVEKGKRD